MIRIVTLFLCTFLSIHVLATPLPVTAATVGGGSGAELLDLTIGAKTYSQSDLIGGTVTGFAGAQAGVILMPNGVSAPAPGLRGSLLGGDFDLETGNINSASGSTAVTFTLNAPVFNRPGPDLVFFEIATNLAERDAFSMQINGTTIAYDGNVAGVWGPSLFNTRSADVNSASLTPSNITQLEAGTTTFNLTSTEVNQGVYGIGLELSDFGVALNDSITTIQYGSRTGVAGAGNGTIDPVLLMGIAIPEPGSGMLLFMGMAGLIAWRKRDKK
ncbi:MAG: hypothetical protein ACI97B_000280 [Verrucomicrobiales bacterium]|jgi:hypothetical protein